MSKANVEKEVAMRCGIGEDEVSQILGLFREEVKHALEAGSSVALPRFGTFSVIKHDDQVSTDLVTGKKMLLPPAVTLEFRESGFLRKKLTGE